MNSGDDVVKYAVCIGWEFVGYPGGGGVYAYGCFAVMESIAKRSSNFASIFAFSAFNSTSSMTSLSLCISVPCLSLRA